VSNGCDGTSLKCRRGIFSRCKLKYRVVHTMNQSPEYQYGIEVEKQIIDILGLIPASQEDNIYNDIDAWCP
jgi:hypothetical protein